MPAAVGDKLFCDCATIFKIFAKTVSSLFLVTVIVKVLLPFIVAPKTGSPTVFSRGILSPLIVDSSILTAPSVIIPSVGTWCQTVCREADQRLADPCSGRGGREGRRLRLHRGRRQSEEN